MSDVAQLTEAERQLAIVKTIPEVKEWDATLAALDGYARAKHWPLDKQNKIVELRALFQRKGGDIVASIPGGGVGGRGHKGKRSTLEHFKMAWASAERWVLLTRLEEAMIREVVAMRTAARQTVTLGYLYGLAQPPEPVLVPPGFPEGPFRTIVIDPPWPIVKVEFSRRSAERSSMDYSVQSLDAIRELPIGELAHSAGAHIYLWVTHRFLPEGLLLFDKWGVRYECVLTWVKPTAQPFWWRFTTEHVLFGKVGSLAPLRKGTPTHFTAPQQRHSHKPDEFFDLVRHVSPESRLTMYDGAREGFTAWGQTHALAE